MVPGGMDGGGGGGSSTRRGRGVVFSRPSRQCGGQGVTAGRRSGHTWSLTSSSPTSTETREN